MIGNVEDENSEHDAKAWNEKGRNFGRVHLPLLSYSNDPPRALFIWRNDGYSVVRRDTGGKMVVQPKIARKLRRKAWIFFIFCNF
jgi:hypothetical protein